MNTTPAARSLPALAILLCSSAPALAQGAGAWSDAAGPPSKFGSGASIVAVGADRLYVVSGGSATGFQRYTISTSTWTVMPPVPSGITTGGTAAFLPATNSIYVLKGAATANFFRYDVGLEAWAATAELAPFPVTAAAGASMAATATRIYVLRGGGSTLATAKEFYEYAPGVGAGVWTRKADITSTVVVGQGGALAYPGAGDFLHAQVGNISTEFLRYALTGVNAAGQAIDTWVPLPPCPETVSSGGTLAAGPAGILFSTTGASRPAFYSFDIASATWTPKAGWTPAGAGTSDSVPFTPGFGAGLAWAPGGDHVFLLRGGPSVIGSGPNHFVRYSISRDKFETTLPQVPDLVGTGGCMTLAGNGDECFVVSGQGGHPRGNSKGFFKYSTFSATWTKLADLPDLPYDGAWMVHGGGDFLFMSQGYRTPTNAFWRYAVAGSNPAGQVANTWQVMTGAPTWGSGTSGVRAGGDYLYALKGGSTAFHRYQISTNTWMLTLAASPTAFGVGSSIVWNGADHLYALAGTSTKGFLTYCISRDQWNVRSDGTLFDPPDLPVFVSSGASLCYPGMGATIYATAGASSNVLSTTFLAYSTVAETWTSLPDLPASAAAGTALAVASTPALHLYALAGNKTRLMWRYTLPAPVPPVPPVALDQRSLDGVTVIPQGGTTPEGGVTLRATCNHPDGYPVKLQVEVAPIASVFTGAPGAESLLQASGSTISLSMEGLSSRDYHWQARTVDVLGRATEWVEFGTAGTDFSVSLPVNDPPGAPMLSPAGANRGQFKTDGVTTLELGETTTQTAVVFKGVAVDPDGNPCRLEVEIKPVTAPFDGLGTSKGAPFASGVAASVAISLVKDSYHWRARAVDSYGAPSAWTIFGANLDGAPADPDLVVDPAALNVPPVLPKALAQFRFDGSTPIPGGGSTGQAAVTFKAEISDRDNDPVRLQVEYRPIGSPFTGTAMATSGAVASGSTGSLRIVGLPSSTGFHWQARAIDAGDRVSIWTSFGSTPENAGEVDFSVPDLSANQPPSRPQIVQDGSFRGQFRLDGSTVVSLGETTNQNGVVLKGIATDPEGDGWQFEVEAKPPASAFNGSFTVLSDFSIAGQGAEVTLSLPNGPFHWRARAIDSSGGVSAWVTFASVAGGNPADPDFTLDTAAASYPPLRPTLLSQFAMDAVTPILPGVPHRQPAFVARGLSTDPDGDAVRLEVEIREVGTAFTGTPMFSSDKVSSGLVATVAVTGLRPSTRYHWQARSIDSRERMSLWVSFGTRPDLVSEVDFEVAVDTAPRASMLRQVNPATGVDVPWGGFVYTAGNFRFDALVIDDEGDAVRLEIEAVPAGAAFNEVSSGSSAPTAGGGTASVDLILPEGAYSWRHRVVETTAFALASPWVPFGPGDGADFEMALPGGSTQIGSATPGCGARAAGAASWAGWAALALLPAFRRRPRPARAR